MNKKHYLYPTAVFTLSSMILFLMLACCFLLLLLKQYIDSFISILIFIILISVSGLLATLVLVFSRKVLIDEAGVHIYVWKRKKKELRWNYINKIEIVLVGRGVLMIDFYTNTKIGLDITTLQVSNYCIRCLSKFAPDFIKGTLAVELSRFGVSI